MCVCSLTLFKMIVLGLAGLIKDVSWVTFLSIPGGAESSFKDLSKISVWWRALSIIKYDLAKVKSAWDRRGGGVVPLSMGLLWHGGETELSIVKYV